MLALQLRHFARRTIIHQVFARNTMSISSNQYRDPRSVGQNIGQQPIQEGKEFGCTNNVYHINIA